MERSSFREYRSVTSQERVGRPCSLLRREDHLAQKRATQILIEAAKLKRAPVQFGLHKERPALNNP
jgi:hypothetical protein